MRKKILPFVAIAIMVFFVACNNEDILTEPEQTFSFTAIMPEANPTTRVTLDEDGKDIVLKWEESDVLNVFVTQGGNTAVGTASITNIYDDGKKATFNPELTGDPIVGDQPFNFYGVYGGGGLSDTNATLPTNPGSATSLEDVESRKDIMLYFAHEGITSSDVNTGVTLNHLGSLFAITLKNNCDDPLALQNAQLEGVTSGNENWAYNAGVGGQTFDLTSQEFQETGTGGNFISFSTDVNILPANGGEMTFWAWYPLLPNNNWPDLQLVLEDASNVVRTSVNSKATRQTSAVNGMTYHFYAEFDGTDLNFTNDQFEVPTTP